MRLKIILALFLLMGAGQDFAQLASPYSQSVWPAQTFTATGQTGAVLQLNGLSTPSSTVGSSFNSGTFTVTGSSLTTVTFSIQGSSDNGVTYYALPIYTAASPTSSPTTTVTATTNGLYQVSLAGITHVRIVTSGTFTATTVSIVFTSSPNAGVAKGSSSGGGSGNNAPVNVVPVEQFGAVADYPGPGSGTGVGTNNTTALQACINYLQTTVGSGQCLLKKGNYRITSAIQITKSGVGFSGSGYGASSVNTSNQLIANAPISAIYIDSATADAIDVNASGSLSAPVSFNKFNDFTIMRTVADSGAGTGCATIGGHAGAAGLSIQFAGGFIINHVWSEDSACPFYFFNAGAYGTGSVENSGVLWGANGFNPGVPVYGFFVNGTDSAESFRLRDSFVQTLFPGFSGVQSVGLFVTGPELNDIMVSRFETAFVTYGEYFQYTGGGNAVSGSDIHLLETINDSFFNTGIVISGLTNPLGGAVEINGGWETTGISGTNGVNIINSSGVTVSNVQFGQNGSQAYGILASGSSNLSIVGNRFLNQATAAIAMGTTSDSTVTGNVMNAISGQATPTFIAGTSLTYTSIIGNAIGGFCSTAGISLDSSSNNNVLQNAIDPTNCAVTVSNAGSNNQLSTSTTWPPSAASPTFSPVAGAISSGTTVTTACTGGSPFISAGTTAVAGATGIAVSSAETLFGSCQGSGYFTTGTAAYTVTGGSIPAAIHFWPMNEGSGATLHDSIGTTNLTATNLTWAVTSGLGATSIAQFGGTTSAVASAVDASLNFNGTQPMTVAFWVKPATTIGGSFAGNLQTGSSFQGWESSVAGASEAGYLVVGAVTTNQMTAVSTSADLSLGTPALVVVTYTGSLNLAGVKEYINGTAQTLTDSSGTLTSGSTSTQPFVVGARGNGTNFYTGAMAYMRVWNSVLTPTQVSSLFALGPQ